MPWILPGIAPTGKRVEVAVVVVVQFTDGRIAGVHIYQDQASVLAQLDLMTPVTGSFPASVRKVVDVRKVPSNRLIRRARE